MKKSRKDVIRKLAFIVITLFFLFASGPVFAQGAGATQGQVALNLAGILGLSTASVADAVAALTAAGITPAGGWSASAPADSNFMAALYTSVQAAITGGSVAAPGNLGSASAVVAAAGTAAGLSGSMVVGAIVSAGGNQGQANTGATLGGSGVYGYSAPGGAGGAGGGAGFGPAGGGGPGGGGGGGGVNPSPSK